MTYPFENLPLRAPSADPADFLVYAIVEQEAGNPIRTYWDATERRFVAKGKFAEKGLPVPYGWLPQTLCAGDGDSLDVIFLTEAQPAQGDYLVVRPLGAMLRADNDHKILAVDINDRRFGQLRNYTELPPELLAQLDKVFTTFYQLSGWLDAGGAQNLIEECHALWRQG